MISPDHGLEPVGPGSADFTFPVAAPGTGGAPPRLVCVACGDSTPELARNRCDRCGGTLHCAGVASLPVTEAAGQGVWRYFHLLPGVPPAHRVSLGEGGTPLLAAPLLSAELGVELLVKDETRNPTGSFKDRILAVSASIARASGAAGLVCASTGNAGAATAAYAARCGLPGVIIAPARAAAAKVAVARAFGSSWISVDGDYSDAYTLALAAAAELGYLNTTTTFISPYSVEGSKTVAFELYGDLAGRVPDWVSVPIGAGPLLVGIEAGYRQLRELGLVDRVPRMLAVQPTGCAPIVTALRSGAATVSAWGIPDTVVGGLADPLNGYAAEGDITMAAVRRSGGAGVAVDDQVTLAYVRRLARTTGVFGEPSGAIAVAGVECARDEGIISPGETVVCCVTGSGLKDLAAIADAEPPPRIRPDVDELAHELEGHLQ